MLAGLAVNLRALGRTQIMPHLLSLVWPYNWLLKARHRDEISLKNTQIIKISKYMTTDSDAVLSSFSPSTPSYLPKCRLKCDELLCQRHVTFFESYSPIEVWNRSHRLLLMSRVAQVKSETMQVFKTANQTQAFYFRQISLWTSTVTLKLITRRKVKKGFSGEIQLLQLSAVSFVTHKIF